MGGYRRSQRKKARQREMRYLGADGVWRTWRRIEEDLDDFVAELLAACEFQDEWNADDGEWWEDTACCCDDEECSGDRMYCDAATVELSPEITRRIEAMFAR